jgi:hypothetical protein
MKTISVTIPTKYEQQETEELEELLQTFLEEFLEEYFERIEDLQLRDQLQNTPRIHTLTHALADIEKKNEFVTFPNLL